jgi:hypothetical protein
MEVHRFRIIYNTIRPHQALAIEHPARPIQVVTSRNRSISGRSVRSEARRFSARYHPRAGGLVRGSQHVGEGPRQHLVDQWARQSAQWATSRYIAIVERGQRPLSVGLEREGGLGVLERHRRARQILCVDPAILFPDGHGFIHAADRLQFNAAASAHTAALVAYGSRCPEATSGFSKRNAWGSVSSGDRDISRLSLKIRCRDRVGVTRSRIGRMA